VGACRIFERVGRCKSFCPEIVSPTVWRENKPHERGSQLFINTEKCKAFHGIVESDMAFFGGENFWLYLPLMVWIGGIFYLSSSRGSISNTSLYFAPVFHFLFPQAGAQTLKNYHRVIRKMGHFLGYAILALLASIVFYNSSAIFSAKFWFVYAFVVVLIVAAADEIRQSFYPNRVGSLADVVLDCLGGLTMIFLFWIFAANVF
jgi:VanZ family protein